LFNGKNAHSARLATLANCPRPAAGVFSAHDLVAFWNAARAQAENLRADGSGRGRLDADLAALRRTGKAPRRLRLTRTARTLAARMERAQPRARRRLFPPLHRDDVPHRQRGCRESLSAFRRKRRTADQAPILCALAAIARSSALRPPLQSAPRRLSARHANARGTVPSRKRPAGNRRGEARPAIPEAQR